MKAYLITMFIIWIISTFCKLLLEPDFSDEVKTLARVFGFFLCLSFAIWTGCLLFK